MATDAASLLTDAKCYASYGRDENSLLLMLVQLNAQLVLQGDPMADVTPQTLLKNANCYASYGRSTNALLLMLLSLTSQLVQGGGGSGGGGLAGVGDPTASAKAGTPYIDTSGTGNFWVNISSPSPGTTWLKLIG